LLNDEQKTRLTALGQDQRSGRNNNDGVLAQGCGNAQASATEWPAGALDSLYSELSDEQKAQFEAIGPGRDVAQASASSDDVGPASHHTRHRHHASVVGLV